MTQMTKNLIYPELSYPPKEDKVTGILFKVL